MRAVRLHGIGDLRVEDIAEPGPPSADQVVVDVALAGICGSDLHNYRTGAWISRAPSVAGHEFTGTIRAAGANAGDLRAGDRVFVDSRVCCGDCPACRAGLGQVCTNLGFVGEAIDGGFANAVCLPVRNVHKAPDGIAFRYLALAEPLAVALHALRRLDAPAGAPVVVTGCGPIGALAGLLAADRGHPILAVDRTAARAALLAEITGGSVVALDGSWATDAPVRHAIDTTGAPPVITALLERLEGGGALALVGIGAGSIAVDPLRLVENEIALVGCHAFADELDAAVALIPALTDALDRLVSEPIALAAVPAAYDDLIAGCVSAVKTLIDCSPVPS